MGRLSMSYPEAEGEMEAVGGRLAAFIIALNCCTN